MARCTSTTNLEIHHKRRDGGIGLDNAKVLCQQCHSNTATYGSLGKSPEAFDLPVKVLAKIAAGDQCQCTSNSACH